MRYCYTDFEKSPVTLEISVEDLRLIRIAVNASAAADGSSYRLRRLNDELIRALHAASEEMHRNAREIAGSLEGGAA